MIGTKSWTGPTSNILIPWTAPNSPRVSAGVKTRPTIEVDSEMRQNSKCWKLVRGGRGALLLLLLTACSDPKLKIGLNVGLAGADVGAMAASSIRMSKVAVDRRFDIRIAHQRATALGTITPKMMAAALDSLANDENVAVIISRFLTNEELEVARNYVGESVPFLSITPLPDGIVSPAGPGFSLVPSLDSQGRFLAEQAKAGDRIAIVHLNSSYGHTLAAALTAALNTRGMAPTSVRTYEQSWDEPRMVALGSELENQDDPTLLFFLGRAPSLELVWQPFREESKEITIIGSDLVESVALYANPEGRYTRLKYVRHFDPQSKDERMFDLHERYGMWIGRGEMTGEAVLVYDGMHLVAEAVRNGARTRDQFREYFASLGKDRPPFKGVGGLISFEQDGTVNRAFQLAEVTNAGIVAVEK